MVSGSTSSTLRLDEDAVAVTVIAEYLRKRGWTRVMDALVQEAPAYFPQPSATASIYETQVREQLIDSRGDDGDEGMLLTMVRDAMKRWEG